jgi:hypothetical protein
MIPHSAIDDESRTTTTDIHEITTGTDIRERTTATESHACPPVRLIPCGHVIGAPCLKAWLRVNRTKDATCLQCTQEVTLEGETRQRVKKVLGHRAVRYVEDLLYYGWWVVVGACMLEIKVCGRTWEVVACKKGRGGWKRSLGWSDGIFAILTRLRAG